MEGHKASWILCGRGRKYEPLKWFLRSVGLGARLGLFQHAQTEKAQSLTSTLKWFVMSIGGTDRKRSNNTVINWHVFAWLCSENNVKHPSPFRPTFSLTHFLTHSLTRSQQNHLFQPDLTVWICALHLRLSHVHRGQHRMRAQDALYHPALCFWIALFILGVHFWDVTFWVINHHSHYVKKNELGKHSRGFPAVQLH